jgi:hypothetical protein
MTIAMSEQVDAEPCDVLRGGDGPVYFLLGGRLYVVHEILGRWIEPEAEPRRGRRADSPEGAEGGQKQGRRRGEGAGAAAREGFAGREPRDVAGAGPKRLEPIEHDRAMRQQEGIGQEQQPAQVEHWLVIASVGRFGTPAVFRLQRRPAPPANGPDRWTVRAERR